MVSVAVHGPSTRLPVPARRLPELKQAVILPHLAGFSIVVLHACNVCRIGHGPNPCSRPWRAEGQQLDLQKTVTDFQVFPMHPCKQTRVHHDLPQAFLSLASFSQTSALGYSGDPAAMGNGRDAAWKVGCCLGVSQLVLRLVTYLLAFLVFLMLKNSGDNIVWWQNIEQARSVLNLQGSQRLASPSAEL